MIFIKPSKKENGLRNQKAVYPQDASKVRFRTLLDMAMLYASKTGAILVGIFILPQFNHLLGAQQFGVIAIIFSFQSLLLLLDLGMSTLVGRDIATENLVTSRPIASWRTAETVITIFYLALLPILLLSTNLINIPLTPGQIAATLLLFWTLTLQNVGQSALLAKRHFIEAGGIQVIGIIVRGISTLLALRLFSPNLTVFLASQVICALLQLFVTRALCTKLLYSDQAQIIRFKVTLFHCVQMAKRGRSLMLFGIAGATVMQLDKSIISIFMSTGDMTPYYLATMLCLTPLSILASPVAQFFQPQLIKAISSENTNATEKVLKTFVTAIILITFVPSLLLWLLREPIITVWLGSAGNIVSVSHYTAILLPGVAIGALGYVPYFILVGREDYRFQAYASSILTILTLTATFFLSYKHSIEGVCWVYTLYHAASTIVSWARCVFIKKINDDYSQRAIIQTFKLVSIFVVILLSALIINNYNKQ